MGLGPLRQWLLNRLYHRLAWAYDATSWLVSLGQWRSWQQAVLPYLVGAPVLELGCGTGALLVALARQSIVCCGVDPSPQMVALAQRRLGPLPERPGLLQGRAQQLPICAGAFAAVVCTFPTDYVLDEQTLEEVWRVLAPGGRWLVVDRAELLPWGVLSHLMRWLVTLFYRGTAPRSLALFLSNAGFGVREKEVALPHSRVWVIVAQKP